MSSNIKIQSTYYPEHKPSFNEWIREIVKLGEQYRRVRYNEHALQARANALAKSFNRAGINGLENRSN